ncbi:MAG: hypothetical protein KatS3mg105_4807 [Gemmatales bacterium]|nr:MAG: hypothetical protein KatS3mg105_4807 [Gemmatales bacterium]
MWGRISIGAAALCLLTAAESCAGVYNLEDPYYILPTQNSQEFLTLLLPSVLDLATNPNNPLAREWLKDDGRVTQLREKARRGDATLDDRINLSGYLLRMGKAEEAVSVLSPASAEGRRHFMFLSNLATAHHLAGRLERAITYLQQAIDVWPDSWPGMKQIQLYWYLRAEKFYLKLLRSRYFEQTTNRGSPSQLDRIFDKVRFVGPGGKYQAGIVGPQYWSEIPQDALLIVQQLLIWLPADARLLWLYAEILNAQGDVVTALTILDRMQFSGRGFDSEEFKEHIRVLKAAVAEREQFFRSVDQTFLQRFPKHQPRVMFQLFLFSALGPRASPLSLGAGPLVNEAATGAHWELIRRMAASTSTPPQPAAKPKGPAPKQPPERMLTYRAFFQGVLVSFGAGVIVTVVVLLQIQEMRRRRNRRLAEQQPAEAREPTESS